MEENPKDLIRFRGDIYVGVDGKFAMAYQPIKSLKTGELSHYESLVRFNQSKAAETVYVEYGVK